MNDSLKIAKIQSKQAQAQLVKELICHPVFSLILGFVLIETLQKWKVNPGDKQGLMPELAGTLAEGALVLHAAGPAIEAGGKVLGPLVAGLTGLATKGG